MESNKLIGKLSISESLVGQLQEKDKISGTLSSFVTEIIEKDYNNLNHKPTINGVEVVGQKTSLDLNISEIFSATSIYGFPNIGSINNIYVDTTNNKAYRWDNRNLKYYIVGSDYNDIKIINGGDAFG